MTATATAPAVTTGFIAHHATPRHDNGERIAADGFRPSHPNRALGAGVYLCRDRNDAAAWAATCLYDAALAPLYRRSRRNRTAEQRAAIDARRAELDACDFDVPVLEVAVPAGLRHATLTLQRTAWSGFWALGDADGTLVERYSSDEESQRRGMDELGPELIARYVSDHHLDVVEVVLDRRHERLRTSQLVVTPDAVEQLEVISMFDVPARCRW